MNVFDNKEPQFAACIIVELNKQASSNGTQYFVRVLYKNKTNSDKLEKLILPACNGLFDCPADTFLKYANANALTSSSYVSMCT